jgi:Skp family chaperone for outer membrane proteins
MKYFSTILMLSLLGLTTKAGAEVFKCKSADKKTVYQAEPCPKTDKQKVVAVEAQTPEQREESLTKLREWQDQQALIDAENAAKAQKQQEQQQEQAKQQAEIQRQIQQQRAIESQQRPTGINRRLGYLP